MTHIEDAAGPARYDVPMHPVVWIVAGLGWVANLACVVHMWSFAPGGVGKKLDGSAIVNGPQKDQMEILLHGKNVMPNWSSLSDTELAAVMTFTRNQWNNHTGEAIQPSAFKAARQGQYPAGGGTSASSGAPANAAQTSSLAPTPHRS